MPFPTDQIEELKLIATSIAACDEGGFSFLLLSDVKMPEGCAPATSDVLLCPTLRDGYNSRLYFPQQIVPPARAGRQPLNWNGSIRIAERNWSAFSWRTPAGLRLAQMIPIHFKALQ